MASTNGTATPTSQGDLNNTSAARQVRYLDVDESYSGRTLAIPESKDETDIRKKYRPFILDEDTTKNDWTGQLELSTAMRMAEADMIKTGERLKVLVLYGSLRNR